MKTQLSDVESRDKQGIFKIYIRKTKKTTSEGRKMESFQKGGTSIQPHRKWRKMKLRRSPHIPKTTIHHKYQKNRRSSFRFPRYLSSIKYKQHPFQKLWKPVVINVPTHQTLHIQIKTMHGLVLATILHLSLLFHPKGNGGR